mgnify:CR=1 FL=1
MFGTITQKFQGLFSTLGRKSKLTESNLQEAVDEVRLALLEADVNYGVTKTFVKRLKEQAVGQELLKSVTAGQQFIKIVHDALVELMGGKESPLHLKGHPSICMVCGLQGAGKTTHVAKLARYVVKNGLAKRPLLAACDLQRPAAVEQLKVLGHQAGVSVFALEGEKDPLQVAKAALLYAKQNGFDLLLVDTAGRLHIDEELMLQLQKLKELLEPEEILLVVNAATGQDAVQVATEFHGRIGITGTILTMLDGNTRGGAAISLAEVTGKPIKFEGVGEKIEDLQSFHPESMAHRILGMGDTINLVRKAQEHFDEKEAESLERKMRQATFTYEDYLKQLQTLKKMGPMKSLFAMLPGAAQLPIGDFEEGEFFKTEAIILSMTPGERAEKVELTPTRRKRIAKGCGASEDRVQQLVKSFKNAKKFFKNMPNMKQLEKMFGGMSWR